MKCIAKDRASKCVETWCGSGVKELHYRLGLPSHQSNDKVCWSYCFALMLPNYSRRTIVIKDSPKFCWSDGCLERLSSKTAQSSAEVMAVLKDYHPRLPKVLLKWWLPLKTVINTAEVVYVFVCVCFFVCLCVWVCVSVSVCVCESAKEFVVIIFGSVVLKVSSLFVTL